MNIQYRQFFAAGFLSVIMAYAVPVEAKLTTIVGPNGETNIDESLAQKNILRSDEQNLFQVSGDNSDSSTKQLIGPTKKSDTLWSIASALSRVSGGSVYQNILAIYHKNPNAFENGNIHKLRPGSLLRVPTRTQISQESTVAAKRKLAQDKKRITPKTVVTPIANQSKIKISSKTASAKTSDVSKDKQTPNKPTMNKLANDIKQSEEKAASSDEASLLNETNQLLRLRLSDMQHQLESLKSELDENQTTENELRNLLAEQRKLYEEQILADTKKVEEELQEEATGWLDIALWGGVAILTLILLGLIVLILRRRNQEEDLPLNDISEEVELDDELAALKEGETLIGDDISDEISLQVDHQPDIASLDTPQMPEATPSNSDDDLAAEWEASLGGVSSDEDPSSDAALAAEWEASLGSSDDTSEVEMELPDANVATEEATPSDEDLAAEWEASLAANSAESAPAESNEEESSDQVVDQSELDALFAAVEEENTPEPPNGFDIDDGEKKSADSVESDSTEETQNDSDTKLDTDDEIDAEISLDEDVMLTDLMDAEDDELIPDEAPELDDDQLLSDIIDDEEPALGDLDDIPDLEGDQLLSDFIDSENNELVEEEIAEAEAIEEPVELELAEEDIAEVEAIEEPVELELAEDEIAEAEAIEEPVELELAEEDIAEAEAIEESVELELAEEDIAEVEAIEEPVELELAEEDIAEAEAIKEPVELELAEEDIAEVEAIEEPVELELAEEDIAEVEAIEELIDLELPEEDIVELEALQEPIDLALAEEQLTDLADIEEELAELEIPDDDILDIDVPELESDLPEFDLDDASLELPENAFLPAEDEPITINDVEHIDLDSIGEFGEEEALEAVLAEESESFNDEIELNDVALDAENEVLIDENELDPIQQTAMNDFHSELELDSLLDDTAEPELVDFSEIDFDDLDAAAGLDMESLLSEQREKPLMSVAEFEQQLAREEEQDILQTPSIDEELIETDLEQDDDIWSESSTEVPLENEDWASQPEIETPLGDELDELEEDIASLDISEDNNHDAEDDFISISELMQDADVTDENTTSPDEIPMDLDVGLDEFPDVMADMEHVDVDVDSESASQLDLAKVYLEMGDITNAEDILSSLLLDQDEDIRDEVHTLLEELRNN